MAPPSQVKGCPPNRVNSTLADLFIRGLPLSITARYFSSNPSDSGSLRTPCPPPTCAAGRQGITPAFGYSAPHPSAGGTLTLLIHALPSAHYGGVRLLTIVHHRLRLLASPMRTSAARVRSLLVDRETSRFPYKERPHMPGSTTTPGHPGARDSAPECFAFRVVDRVGTQKIPVFAAQWLACAFPCRRFTCLLTKAGARLGADVDR